MLLYVSVSNIFQWCRNINRRNVCSTSLHTHIERNKSQCIVYYQDWKNVHSVDSNRKSEPI